MATSQKPAGSRGFTLGSAPDSWGVWFPDDPKQLPWEQFLDELAAAGYTWLELGPYGYLPTDPSRLEAELASRGLRVSGGTTGGALHHEADWPAIVSSTRSVAALVAAMGAEHLIFIPEAYRDLRTGEEFESPDLDADTWRTLTHAADELGRIIATEFGVSLDLHSHADSHIETPEQIDRFLDDTDASFVSLCLDTGHIAYGGGDNEAIIRAYPDRIGYVHIKQMDPTILAECRADKVPFAEAVQRGVTVEPPNGSPDIEAVLAALREVGRDRSMFCIVEQDMYPCAPDYPLPIAQRTHDYLSTIGLGAGE